MHGLINTALQSFCKDAYGTTTWNDVLCISGSPAITFEAMLEYTDPLTDALLDAMGLVLSKPRDEILEDLGTYLVSHPNMERLRRLLRFSGVTFEDFLYSLDDLPDRARLAVPDLNLPRLELRELSPTDFVLTCTSPLVGGGHVFLGVLRAMADDYGALVFLEFCGRQGEEETITVNLVERSYAEGRQFDLAARQ